MVASCSVPGCTSRFKRDLKIKFHRFPKEPILRQKWLEAVGRKNWEPKEYSSICSCHFIESDYIRNFGKCQLRKNVIPTIFLCTKEVKNPQLQDQTVSRNLELQTPGSVTETTNTAGCSKETQISTNLECNTGSTHLPFEEIPVPEEKEALRIFQVPYISIIKESSKSRQSSQPVYFGDYTETNPPQCPSSIKKMWRIASSCIKKQRRTILKLQREKQRMKEKIKALQDFLAELKNKKKSSWDGYSVLKI